MLGDAGAVNVQGEAQKKLDVVSNDGAARRRPSGPGMLAGMVSEEMDGAATRARRVPRGKYLLVFDPLDGSSNLDVNITVGTIFSILRAPDPGADPVADDFLQPGHRAGRAGFALYGPATMLVLTIGSGVDGFTSDREHRRLHPHPPHMRIPDETTRVRDQRVQRAASGSRRSSATSRSASPGRPGRAARTSTCAGSPRWWPRPSASSSAAASSSTRATRKDPAKPGRLRLLYEANPIGIHHRAGRRPARAPATAGSM